MSTLKVAAINNPSASSGGLAISASGNVTGAGLDLITTQSFSAVSSVSVNNCFSATYDNYRVILDAQSSGVIGQLWRFRASGTDNTAANYTQVQITAGTSVAVARSTGNTNADLFYLGSGVKGCISIDVIGPNISAATRGQAWTTYDVTLPQTAFTAFNHTAATSFDGFTLYQGSGTFTGTVSVYGYRK